MIPIEKFLAIVAAMILLAIPVLAWMSYLMWWVIR